MFKPGVAKANSSFEAMSLLYRHCRERHGADVELFVDRADTFRSEDLRITRLDGRSPPSWLQAAGAPAGPFYPTAWRRLRDFDAVVTTDPYIYYHSFLPALLARRLYGCGLLVDVSLTFVPETARPGWQGELRTRLARRWSRAVDAFLATTPAAVGRLRTLGAVEEDGDRARVLGHPVDVSRFRPGDRAGTDGIRALSVGRLVEQKGHLDLVRAMAPLFDEFAGLSLRIVGGGPLEDALRAEVDELGLGERVEILGELPHGELPDQYRSADLFVGCPHRTPFWEEYFGVTYVEAMSSGLPVVTTRCGGIPHVVPEGECGLLVPERDPAALRAAIRELVESPSLRRELGRKAREHARERYSVEVLGERFHRICRAAADRAGVG